MRKIIVILLAAFAYLLFRLVDALAWFCSIFEDAFEKAKEWCE